MVLILVEWLHLVDEITNDRSAHLQPPVTGRTVTLEVNVKSSMLFKSEKVKQINNQDVLVCVVINLT